MIPPPPIHKPSSEILADRVLLSVTLPDATKPIDREGRTSAGMKRHGDNFIMEIVTASGGVLEIKFTHDALADHRDRCSAMLR